MSVYDIRATLPVVSGFYATAHALTHFCLRIIHYISESARLKLADLFRENESSEPTRFQPVSYNRNFVVGQTYLFIIYLFISIYLTLTLITYK